MVGVAQCRDRGHGPLSRGKVQATPPDGFAGTTLAQGRFGEIDVFNHFIPPSIQQTGTARNVWLSLQKTKGVSDLYVQSNVWASGRKHRLALAPRPQPDRRHGGNGDGL